MATRYKRKPEGAYHHPDLQSALVAAAVRVIRDQGLEALTLRGVGEMLGVSRTALYRHFEDKQALLARVALEGFRLFRRALEDAVTQARAAGEDPVARMGVAYVKFALANSSHYLTMFGVRMDAAACDGELAREGEAAFMVLVRTLAEEIAAGRAPAMDPGDLAHVVWANVHGVAMLTIHGQFAGVEWESVVRDGWVLLKKARR